MISSFTNYSECGLVYILETSTSKKTPPLILGSLEYSPCCAVLHGEVMGFLAPFSGWSPTCLSGGASALLILPVSSTVWLYIYLAITVSVVLVFCTGRIA